MIYNNYYLILIVSKKDEGCFLKGENKMVSMHTAGNFIIHLYDKINGKFGCSQIKLEKMLILAQVEYHLKYNKDLINDIDIVFAENCGFSLDTSDTYFRSPITVSTQYDDTPLDDIYKSVLKTPQKSKIFRFSESDLDDEAIDFLIDIFCKYASYLPKSLGKILDKIKSSKIFIDLKSTKGIVPFDIPIALFYKMVSESNFKED